MERREYSQAEGNKTLVKKAGKRLGERRRVNVSKIE